MKQFLYLDTDIVNSIIAQSENGIATGSSTEVTHKKSDGQDVKFSAEGQVTAGGAIQSEKRSRYAKRIEGHFRTDV